MSAQRLLVILGLILFVLGLLWPYLGRLPIGRLPGDILIRRDGFTFYAPIATCLIVSLLLTLLFWLVRR